MFGIVTVAIFAVLALALLPLVKGLRHRAQRLLSSKSKESGTNQQSPGIKDLSDYLEGHSENEKQACSK